MPASSSRLISGIYVSSPCGNVHVDGGGVGLQQVATQVLAEMLLVGAQDEALALLGDAAARLDLPSHKRDEQTSLVRKPQ